MNKVSPFQITGPQRPGRWLITCDHATNIVPAEFETTLGISAADMGRHISHDIGALGVTLELAALLDSPSIHSLFSRLVIDPNRGALDPTLVMKLYDGTIIPANRHADSTEVERRLNRYHRPYHEAVKQLAGRQRDTVICAIHSFTPQLKGQARRPWQIGILSGEDKRLTAPLIDALQNAPELIHEANTLGEPLCVGDNAPYIGYFPGDAIDTHATPHGRANVLIELRSDLIETPDRQRHWAGLLAPILTRTLTKTGL